MTSSAIHPFLISTYKQLVQWILMICFNFLQKKEIKKLFGCQSKTALIGCQEKLNQKVFAFKKRKQYIYNFCLAEAEQDTKVPRYSLGTQNHFLTNFLTVWCFWG